ncbi:MAG: alkaline phosphatase family protein [Candidatus Aminicenantes bacterium]|nr:alkaline phosphatase family protein [Candidatus Aminicenantes bacterium]
MHRRDFIKKSIIASTGLGAACCGGKEEEKIKVVILGFDGANWATIDPLIKKGELPFLKKLKEESAWANFETFKPAKSNVVWTSIASGKTMLKHGILDYVYLKKNGIKVPYTRADRKEPMIWQILDSFGKRSTVINWWCSHPPDKIKGVMVSDHFRRVIRKRVKRDNSSESFATSVFPAEFFEKLIRVEMRKYPKVLQETGLPNFPGLYNPESPWAYAYKLNLLKGFPIFARMDAFVEKISDYLYTNVNVDFFATYFRLPDVVQHFVLSLFKKEYIEGVLSAIKTNTLTREKHKEVIDRISGFLKPVYRYMENIIEKYITENRDSNTYFFIMSDHGFSLYDKGYNHYGLPDPYQAPDGILLIKGPRVKKGRIKKASVFDIAPTILNLYDLPVGKNMDGRVLSDVFRFHRKKRYKVYKLKKDGRMKRDESYDKETLDGLESLGYI